VIRSVLLYLVLVGLPVAGVSAVLRAGRELTPPTSFGGSWVVEAWPDSVCQEHQPDTLELMVDQSGPSLSIKTRRGPRFIARVEGDSFVAHGPNKRVLRARRLNTTEPAIFEGLLTAAPCDAATQTRLRGTRVQLPFELTGH